ncbi:GTPase [Providencia stuartii]|uniref:50S ribosome-binding GTPase n=1 Tax=Moellerella wisconsensis TaxID=158849 RepID=A0ACD3Y4L4_9GAMM|nr:MULTISPECIES: GTPase [Morganellaceae]UNH37951.1 50S ribosome-binding GTPase [Moellerella wisconsensis]
MNKQVDYGVIIEKAASLLSENISDGKPTVAVWGLLNAGKSYLLNMLSDHINDEYFRTGDIRVTSKIKTLETSNFIFMDTPGIDANNHDDKIAIKSAESADAILFVHQAIGELDKAEIKHLRKIKQSFGRYAEKNIIIIISKADKESPDKIDVIKKRILKQCSQNLGFIPTCFSISGTRFKTGVLKNKEGLIRNSGIPALTEHLNTLTQEVLAVKYERRLITVKELLNDFDKLDDVLKSRQVQTQKLIQDNFRQFNQSMDSLRHWIDNNKQELRG